MLAILDRVARAAPRRVPFLDDNFSTSALSKIHLRICINRGN